MTETSPFANLPKKLYRSNSGAIFYTRETLDKVFSTQIEVQPFFAEAEKKFASLGLTWDNKLLLGFDQDGTPQYSDSVNDYRFNSHGYRSPEFDGSAKVLYAGCSTTFGTGVPVEGIWGSIVADTLGLPWASISKQGTSAQWIVKNVFAYFDEYGHPDVVCCLFPDLYRMTIATNPFQLRYSGNGLNGENRDADDFTKIYDIHLDHVLPPKAAIEYSKKPHEMENVLPADAAVYSSMQSILLLDQYCRSHGIKFVWSTWDINASVFLDTLKNVYPRNYSNFVNVDLDCWINNPDKNTGGEVFIGTNARQSSGKNLPPLDCHGDWLKKYGTNFHRGLDEFHGIEHTHPGIHQHVHIAEAFVEAIENY